MPPISGQVETIWGFAGDLGIHNFGDYVNIDGDPYPDHLIYERVNNKLKYIAWQSHRENRIGNIRAIQLPSWPVWSCGAIDLDQDGDGEILMTHATTGDLYVCYQVCPEEFAEPVQLENITAQYSAFKVHDANGDGIDDLVGSSYNEPFTYYMQHGLGNGEFGPLNSVHIGWTEVFARRFQDLDSDGYTDITVTTGAGERIVYYPGQEEGGWGGERTVITGIPAPWSSAIGDIDGDGHKDVIVANFNGSNQPIYIAHNDGSNNFDKEELFDVAQPTTMLECADLNNDGRSEILLGGPNGTDVWLFKNNGNFNFSASKITDMFRPTGNFTDYDNDGILDIILRDLEFYPERYYWWKGSPNGSAFEEMGTFLPVNGSLPEFYIAQWNQDLLPDKLLVQYNFGDLDVYLAEGYGNGRFKEARLVESFSATGDIQPIDHNGDGKYDVITNSQGSLFYHLNSGDGHFAPGVLMAENVRDFVALDTRRDGYMDYLFHKKNTDSIFMVSFDALTPATTTLFKTNWSNVRLVSADFNGDAFPDIALFSNTTDRIDIYANRLNEFEQVFSSTQFTGSMDSPLGMDFDWDGITDLMLLYNGLLQWAKGFEDGSFGTLQLIPLAGGIYRYSILDVAGDERPEIVVTSSVSADGYYQLISPATLGGQQNLFTTSGLVITLADLNLDRHVDGMLYITLDTTLRWIVSHEEQDFPYVITSSPCDGNDNVSVNVIENCLQDFVVLWEDGTIGNVHPGLSSGMHHYYVVKENDTLKTVPVLIHIDPLRIDTMTITPDDGFTGGAFHMEFDGGHPPYAVSWRSESDTTGNNQAHLVAGLYLLHIVDGNGCSLDTLIEIPLETSSTDLPQDGLLSVYPSPASHVIFIQSQYVAVELISIVQPDGKAIPLSIQLEPGEVYSRSVDDCPPGIFCLLYRSGKEVFTIKFLRI